MKTKISNRFSRTLTSAFILLALIASTVVPAWAQTRRRPVLRRRAPARKVVKTVAPSTVYYNVNAGQIIRVRINQNISSETARIGDHWRSLRFIALANRNCARDQWRLD